MDFRPDPVIAVDAPATVRGVATLIRRHCRLGRIDCFPVLPFLELHLHSLVDNLDIEVLEDNAAQAKAHIDGTLAHTYGPVIHVGQRCYEAAHRGLGGARLAILRETCLVVLCRTASGRALLAASGATSRAAVKRVAALLAFELLMPQELLAMSLTQGQFATAMGVSRQALRSRGRREPADSSARLHEEPHSQPAVQRNR